MNPNRLAYFGIFLLLFCCTPARLKSGGYGEYRASTYRAFSETAETERVFNQMMEQRDIKMAINTLICEGFTSDQIQDAVQNRLVRIRGWHFPGDFCCAQGNVAEPGETTVVGPTYYLIVVRARIMRYIREIGSINY